MIGTLVLIGARNHDAAIGGVPVLWAKGSASFLGHPARPVFLERSAKRARATFSDPGASPPDPRPVDAAGPMDISDEAGDLHRPLENAQTRVFHEPPPALRLIAFTLGPKARSKAKKGNGAEAP